MNLRRASYHPIEHRLLIITPMKFHITVTKVAIFFTILIYVHSRDSMIVTTLDTCTSVFAGCTVFAVLGHLMEEMDEDDIDEVVRDGPGVAFVTYAKVIAKFGPISQVSEILCMRVG